MTTLVVPPLDEEPWPTLGPQVCGFIETYLVFGPGDLRGRPARLDDEKRALIYRIYEVFPPDHPQAGRRRFRRVGLSLRKGSAKTEFAAWIAACELHPDAPVRCVGFDGRGQPIGRGVTDPYIPMVSYTLDQTEELAYGALYVAIAEGPLAGDFDIGLERIMRKTGGGKAEALASSPNARDGARTTFQVFDETHRLSSARLRQAHRTMLANLPKRRAADPWALEISTAGDPGEESVYMATYNYALAVDEGRVADPRLFYFHRQAAEDHDLTTREGVRAAVIEASGPVAAWSDIEGIVDQFFEPDADLAYITRVWLNRHVRAADKAFDTELWASLAVPEVEIEPGALITLGFDGSRRWDSTYLVATHVVSGYQWVLGAWERPPNATDAWEVPEWEVSAAVELAFGRYTVFRMYSDPPYWETHVATWAGEYGDERVIAWRTNRVMPMAYAIKSFVNAMAAREISHSGDAGLHRHIGNACRRYVHVRNDEGTLERLFLIVKDRPESPRKMDGAMAAVISWEARRDALAAGAAAPPERSVYETRGIRVIGG